VTSAKFWGDGGVKGNLTLTPPFEVLHALAELVVGKMYERPCFAKLLGDSGLILCVSDIDEGIEAFGQELHVMAEAFDQHSGVPLHFVKALINRIEPSVNPFEAPIVSV